MTDNPKVAILYTRVSTEDQADSGLGLEHQLRMLEAQAIIDGWEEVEHIEDAGASGKSMNRPGMHRILHMVKTGQTHTLAVYKLDRLGRNVKDMLLLVELLEKHNVALASVSERLNTDTAIGRLLMTILMSLAEWERATTAERTAAALGS